MVGEARWPTATSAATSDTESNNDVGKGAGKGDLGGAYAIEEVTNAFAKANFDDISDPIMPYARCSTSYCPTIELRKRMENIWADVEDGGDG